MQTSHNMTQSHAVTNSEQNFRKNNTGQARQMNHAGQASFEIEHIIVDGASTDNTLEINNVRSLRQVPQISLWLMD